MRQLLGPTTIAMESSSTSISLDVSDKLQDDQQFGLGIKAFTLAAGTNELE